MVDVQLHLRGQAVAERSFPAMPRGGDYLEPDDGLHVVSAVVLQGDACHVYAAPVAGVLAERLRGEWATWGDVQATPEPADKQKGLFT